MRFIFIRVPRTASLSVMKALRVRNVRSHRPAKKYVLQLPGYYSAAFVRHPADRLWSTYNSSKQHKKAFRRIRSCESWEEFVDLAVGHPRSIVHTTPQEYFLTFDGKIIVDFIGKFENLQEDYLRLCGILNIRPRQLPWEHKSEHCHWSEVCNYDIMMKIKKAYRRDFELFGYR